MFAAMCIHFVAAIEAVETTDFSQGGIDTGQSGGRGVRYNQSVTLAQGLIFVNVTKSSSMTCTTAVIYDTITGLWVANATFSGDVAVWNFQSVQGRAYDIMGTTPGGTCNMPWQNGVGYPKGKTLGNFTSGMNGFGVPGTNNLWGILNIGVKTPVVAAINITLTSPANNSVIVSTSTNLTANYTVVGYNMTNSTYELRYSNGTIKNITTVQVKGNSSNSTMLAVFNLSIGSYMWNVNLCVTNLTGQAVNCTVLGPYNSTFSVGASGNFSYSNRTFETSSERFAVNISILEGTSISGAALFYNGTIYNTTTVNLLTPTLYAVNTTIAIPLNPDPFANTTRNFFWIINYLDGSQQNLTVLTQNVSFINLQLCNSTFNLPTLNFSLKNESNFADVNGSIQVNFQYYLGTGSLFKNFSYNSTGGAGPSRYDFCITPNPNSLTNSNFTASMIMSYTAPDYVERYYYLVNSVLSNTTSQVDLLLLPSALAQIFYLDVKRGVEVINDAQVFIAKQYISLNTYKTVGLRITDSNGKFIEFLELNKNYQFTVVRNGTIIGVVSQPSICSTSPCEMTLQIPTSAGNVFQSYDETFANNVVYNLSFNQNTNMVTFTYVDVTGMARYARLFVEQLTMNNTAVSVCDTSLFSVAGTISCNMTGYEGDFKATTYIARSPEKIIAVLTFLIEAANQLGEYPLLLALLFGSVIVAFFFWLDLQLGIYSVPGLFTVIKFAHLYAIAWPVLIGLWIGAIFLAGRVQR